MLAYLNAIAFHVFVILKFCYEFDPLSALVWPHVATVAKKLNKTTRLRA